MLLAMAAPALSLILGSPALAQDHDGHDHGGHQHPPAQHGGTLASSGSYQFEVVFKEDGLAVYPHGPSISPMAITQMSGQAFFLMPGARTYSRPYTLRPAAGRGGPADSLGLAVDLSRVPASGARVTIRVLGLPDADGSRAEFTVPFARAETGALTVTKATKADAPAIARLKLCPVSGEELGSMGGPLKVARGNNATFLCCQGCLEKVEADPVKYLGAAAGAGTPAHHEHQH
jgi:hypothetical protein